MFQGRLCLKRVSNPFQTVNCLKWVKQFETGFKQFQIVSNTRRLKCNETRLHEFQTPDLVYSCQQLKFISGTNIIIQQKSRMVIQLWFLKTKIVALTMKLRPK